MEPVPRPAGSKALHCYCDTNADYSFNYNMYISLYFLVSVNITETVRSTVQHIPSFSPALDTKQTEFITRVDYKSVLVSIWHIDYNVLQHGCSVFFLLLMARVIPGFFLVLFLTDIFGFYTNKNIL